MKIVVAGKGGAGKTTVSATIARAFGRAGHRVLALDADSNPMLGISLGVGPEQTDRLGALRQALDAGELEHEPTVEGMVDAFGADAPDGVRLVVVSRIDNVDPPCPCCGVSPEQLLGELERDTQMVVCDLEAGLGTVLRMQAEKMDTMLVVAEPSAKSIEVARRAAEAAADRAGLIVVANRIRGEDDLELIREALGDQEIVAVPEEPAIALADREGRAPLDVDPEAPGVRAIVELAERLAADARAVPAA